MAVWPQFGQVSVDCSSAGLAVLLAQQEDAEATVTVTWDWAMSLGITRFGQEGRLVSVFWLIHDTQERHAEPSRSISTASLWQLEFTNPRLHH